jgi:ACT domain-containing protein
MAEEVYKIRIESESNLAAQQGTRSLADNLREVTGVLDVERHKEDDRSMELGTILTIIATSSATLAIAQGLADWIRRTRGATVTIEKDQKSKSIKAAVSNIDQATALRIVEIIRRV